MNHTIVCEDPMFGKFTWQVSDKLHATLQEMADLAIKSGKPPEDVVNYFLQSIQCLLARQLGLITITTVIGWDKGDGKSVTDLYDSLHRSTERRLMKLLPQLEE